MARVLIVDDDPRLRRSIAEVLSRAGYEACPAANGKEGWDLLCAQEFDVVLTDVYMPETDGIGFINRVRGAFPAQRIIAMSGGGLASSEFVLSDAHLLGAAATLQKPFSRRDILDVVDSMLRGE